MMKKILLILFSLFMMTSCGTLLVESSYPGYYPSYYYFIDNGKYYVTPVNPDGSIYLSRRIEIDRYYYYNHRFNPVKPIPPKSETKPYIRPEVNTVKPDDTRNVRQNNRVSTQRETSGRTVTETRRSTVTEPRSATSRTNANRTR